MPKLFAMLSLLWMGFIFYLSSLTGSDLSDFPKISDVLGHGALYFILGSLLYLSFSRHAGKWTVLIAALFGLSDEFHQSFVPGRTPEVKDFLVDTLAALAAVLIIKFIINIKGRVHRS